MRRVGTTDERSTRIATPVICLAGILALTCLLAKTGVKLSSELLFMVPFYFGPSIVLAFLGYQGAKSKARPGILSVCAIVSTALWILITLYVFNMTGIDAQVGLGVMFVGIVQWFIVVFALLACVRRCGYRV